MDTISRDNNSSYLPVAGAIVGLLALVLSVVALVKVSSANKLLADHDTKVQKIDGVEAQANTAAATADKAAKDLTRLASQTQDAVTQIGTMIGDIKGSITKLEEAQKKPAAAKNREPAVAGPGEYIVKAGDTFAKIAREHGTTITDIQTVNSGVDSSRLKIGQKIKLPAKR